MFRALLNLVGKIRESTRGNAMVLAGIALPVLVGMTGLAVEGGAWYYTKRDMQNAADAASLAATATNGTNYVENARAVAAQYGYNNGVDNTTVTVINDAACPSGASNCYRVTITKNVALIFSKVIGYEGTATMAGSNSRAIALTSNATASPGIREVDFCVVTLSPAGTGFGFEVNGGPNIDMSGCNLMSNSNMNCNGSNDMNANAYSVGYNTTCGEQKYTGVAAYGDSFASKASAINTDSCSSPSNTSISGSISATVLTICGNLTLTGDVTLTSPNTVITIRDGFLDLNNRTIRTAAGASATIIFTGTNGGGYGHTPTGRGTIDIQAPTTGPWSGIAIYQDPALTSNVDVDYRGSGTNAQTWNVTGLVYLPNSDAQFRGVVNKSTNGAACTIFVVSTMLINGTGNTLARGTGCAAAGLDPPSTTVTGGRGNLVA